CRTVTSKTQKRSNTSNVAINRSLLPPNFMTPPITDEFNRSFKLVRSLPCDVQVGDHPAQYDMETKFAKLRSGGRNPFIDSASCRLEADIEEAMFHAILAEQKAAQP